MSIKMGYHHSMKVNKGEFEKIEALLKREDTEDRREKYRAGQFPRAAAVKDLDMRYRWDLFWMRLDQARREDDTEVIDFLTAYGADAHMDTVLRRIVRPLPDKGATP